MMAVLQPKHVAYYPTIVFW